MHHWYCLCRGSGRGQCCQGRRRLHMPVQLMWLRGQGESQAPPPARYGWCEVWLWPQGSWIAMMYMNSNLTSLTAASIFRQSTMLTTPRLHVCLSLRLMSFSFIIPSGKARKRTQASNMAEESPYICLHILAKKPCQITLCSQSLRQLRNPMYHILLLSSKSLRKR